MNTCNALDHKYYDIDLNITSLCNLRCAYCSIPEVSKSTKVPEKTIKRNFKIWIKKLINSSYKPRFIMVIGAEPLMASKELITYIINKIHKHFDIYVKIQTNGTLLTDEYANYLFKNLNKPEKLKIGWSIDGVKSLHDKYRDNSYDLAMLNMLNCAKKYPFLNHTITTVGHEHFQNNNEDELLNFIKVCHDNNIEPTISVADYSLNPKAKSKYNITFEEVWKPLANFLIKNNLLHLCRKYLAVNYCRRHKNNCPRILFDMGLGGVYTCEKTFDVKNAQFSNYINDENNNLDEHFQIKQCYFKDVKISDECKECEFYEFCQGGCPLKRDETGKPTGCEFTKYILEYLKYKTDLKDNYLEFLKNI